LDKVPYHGRVITIVWDKTGEKYKGGKGFYVLVDGKVVIRTERLERVTYSLK